MTLQPPATQSESARVRVMALAQADSLASRRRVAPARAEAPRGSKAAPVEWLSDGVNDGYGHGN